MKRDPVILKGNKKGIVMILDTKKPFKDIVNGIRKKLMQAERFSNIKTLHVGFKGRALNDEERHEINDMFEHMVGKDIKIAFEEERQNQRTIFEGIEEGVTRFHRGTVRSGQNIEAKGNLVIIGDVNPGGEVCAGGNIVVMGALRGMVHAGFSGNRKAIVAAFNLQPMQLRIADVLSRSPDEEARHKIIPEYAYIKNNRIEVDHYLSKKKIR